jgi:hypothetical protein
VSGDAWMKWGSHVDGHRMDNQWDVREVVEKRRPRRRTGEHGVTMRATA